MIDTTGKYLENFFRKALKLPIANAVSINGTARPNEYSIKRNIPFPIVVILPA
jgi:hypothetical protein